MAEQEQRMAEQERRISAQERNLAGYERDETVRDRDPPDERKRQDMSPSPNQPASSAPEWERPPDEVERQEMPPPRKPPASNAPEWEGSPDEVDEAEGGIERQQPRRQQTASVQTTELEDGRFGEPLRAGQREELPVHYDEEEVDNPPPGPRRQAQDWIDTSEHHERPPRRPSKQAARRQQTPSESEHNPHAGDNGSALFNGNGNGSRVYDEYLQLLAETEESSVQSDEESGQASPTAPMDINLVASLLRWASTAKQRVGEDRLHDILELYLQSGHATPGLREVLTHISGMANAMGPETDQTAQECVDLISHLHGILTGALAIVRVPQIKIPA